MSNDKIRGEFEAWATTSGKGKEITSGLIQTCMGIYVHGITQTIWVGWRAALSQSEPVQVSGQKNPKIQCKSCGGIPLLPVDENNECPDCSECRFEKKLIAKEINTAVKVSKEYLQFLTDVMTAAGLVSHGKQCKDLGFRLASGCVTFITYAQPILISPPDYEALKAENKELKMDVDCYASANICFKRIKTNLQADVLRLQSECDKLVLDKQHSKDVLDELIKEMKTLSPNTQTAQFIFVLEILIKEQAK